MLRSQHHYIDDIRLNIFRPATVATATIDNTPDSNPASELTVTGTVSATEVGQRFIIRDSSDNVVSHGTLRKATSGQTLRISPVSIGDSGYVQPIRRAISSGDTITIYEDRPLWGDYSRIAGGTFRKLWDVGYTDENEDPPPIANTGASQSARVSVGGSANFTLPRSGSNDSFAFGSKTISTYAWSLPTGVTLQGGYATSDSVIGVTATQGQHIIALTITDSAGKTHTAYTYLFVSDGVNYLDVLDQYTARIDSDTQDRRGRTLTFTVYGESLESQILPGAYVHLQHDSRYDGSALTDGVDVDTFVGYITGYQYSHNGDYGQAVITAVSPYLYLQRVYMPSQLITEKGNPSRWSDVTSDLSNPRGALSYIRWQSQNVFAMHDIDAPYTTPRKYSYEYNGKTVASGLDVAGYAVAGTVGSASDGTLVLRKDPNHENNAFRNALAVGMTFNEDDVTVPLEHPVSVIVPFADIRAGAFAYNGGGKSGIKAWYGQKRWSQGSSETVLPDFTVTVNEGLDTVLEKVGHIAANEQYPDEQPLTFNGNINLFDPAWMIWYRLNIADTYDPRGDGWDNVRFLPTRVNRSWDPDTGTLTIQAQIKRETFGQKADRWEPGSGNTVMSGFWVTQLGLDYTPTTNDFTVLSNVAIAYNTSGNLAITQSFSNVTPTWYSLDDFITGNASDVCYDYNSAFFTGGYNLTQPLSVYVVSVSGTSLYVYRIYDIKSSTIEIELLTTYTMNDSSCTTEARIQCSSGTGTLAVVAWHDQTGVEFGRTTDGGATWSAKANVGSVISDTVNDNAPIGLYISGTNQIITAPDGSSDYGAYLATTAGGSFSALTNTETSKAPATMITGDGNTTLYVALDDFIINPTPEYTVDFDAGFSGYTVSDVNAGSAGDTATGNPGNAAFGQIPVQSNYTFNCRFDIDITLSASETVTRIEFDMYHNLDFTDAGSGAGVPTHMKADFEYTGGGGGSPIIRVIHDTPTFQTLGDLLWTKSGEWHTYSIPVEYTTVTAIAIEVGINGADNDFDVNATSQIRLDNIKIWTAGQAEPSYLYKVTTYPTTDSWSDVSPDVGYTPELPYGVAVDVADSNNLEVTATNNSIPKYYQSANAGSSYTDRGASDYRAVKRIGNAILYGGISSLDLSLDSGTTVTDKLGNLDATWGAVGTIKNILVVGAQS